MLHLARDLDSAVEEQRCVGLQARLPEGLEGEVRTIGGQSHVGEAAAILQPLAALGIEFGVLDDPQDLEIVLVENHQVVGRAELPVEAAWLNLEPEAAVGGLRGVDAVDHDHDVVEPFHRAFHAGLLRTMLIPFIVTTSSPL